MLNISHLIQRRQANSFYSDCDSLPVFNFIKCLTSQDMKWLIIKGKPKQTDLSRAWANISEQYGELSENSNSSHLLNCMIDMDYLLNQLKITQSLIDEMAKGYDERIADLFRELGYTFIYNGDLKASLQMIINQTKGIVLDLEAKKDEFKALTKDSEKNTTEAQYNLLIADLSKFIGSVIDIKTMCVSQFIGIYNLYKKHHEQQQPI